MMNRKANMTLNSMGTLILVLVVVVVTVIIFTDKNSEASTSISGLSVTQALTKCRDLEGSTHPSTGKPLEDKDGDGLPDVCDTCPSVSNSDVDDKDGDYFPKGCKGNNGAGEPYCDDDDFKDYEGKNEDNKCYEVSDDNSKKHPGYNPSLVKLF